MIDLKRFISNSILIILAICSTSCGGGGGGGGSTPTTTSAPTTTTPDNTNDAFDPNNFTATPQWDVDQTQINAYETIEYNSQSGLNQINAASAYAILNKNGKSNGGLGVKIAIIDSGALITHNEIFANYDKTDSNNDGDYDNDYDYFNSDNDPTDDNGHGSHVASTAAAVKDGSGMHGVAFNSEIVAFKALGSTGLGSDVNIANSIEESILVGAKVINLSLGGTLSSGLIKNALLSAKAADLLTIAATGNDGASQPNYPAYRAIESDLAGYILAVGSVDGSSNISSFSNYCGDTKDYCLVAPGENIYGAYYTGDSTYAYYRGTSMATPHVTGAAAVIRAAWPHLTAVQTAQILLQTATDLGDAGVDNVYGHGLLNLEFAVQAQGQNALNYGTSVYSGSYDLRNTSIITDPIFGDAFTKNISPKINSAIFLDDFGRDYKSSLGKKISSKSSVNNYSASNILFNNYSNNLLPMNLTNHTKLNFQIPTYKNKEVNNELGLKFATIDNSQESKLNQNQGFSFQQNFKIDKEYINWGFSFNIDESTNLNPNLSNKLKNSLIADNISSKNPFQSFFKNNSLTIADNKRYFKQVFVNKDLFSNNFNFNFLYQDSYDANNLYSNINTKQNELLNFGLDYKLNKKNIFSLSLGNLTEFDNNILNSKSYGAFETTNNVKTSFLKIASQHQIASNINLVMSYSEGFSDISGNPHGIFRDFSKINSRSFGSALVFENSKNSKIGLAYTQPLRVYSGQVKYDIPVARDIYGNLYRQSGTASLVPNGREEDFEIFYQNQLSDNKLINFNFLIQKEAGNIKDAPLNYLGLVTFNKIF